MAHPHLKAQMSHALAIADHHDAKPHTQATGWVNPSQNRTSPTAAKTQAQFGESAAPTKSHVHAQVVGFDDDHFTSQFQMPNFGY